jgi:hypothetical protein
MDQVRGIVMIALGVFACYQGFAIHTGDRALLAYGVGVLALAVGVWRLTRKPPQRLR